MSDALFTRAFTALMPHWRLDDVTDVVYLPGGYSNTNFAFRHGGKRYVLRIPQRSQPYVDRAHEASWYRRMPQGLAPEPLALDQHTGLMVTPWIDGRLLIDAWPSLSIDTLSHYLHALHDKMPHDDRHYDLTALMAAYGCKVDEVPALVGPAHTCHNDLNPWNVIVTDRAWITLDWEFVGLNDPLFDLVSLHQGLGGSMDELTVLASQYLDQDVDPDRLRAAVKSFWLREYGWAHHQLVIGNDRAEIQQQQQTAADMLNDL